MKPIYLPKEYISALIGVGDAMSIKKCIIYFLLLCLCIGLSSCSTNNNEEVYSTVPKSEEALDFDNEMLQNPIDIEYEERLKKGEGNYRDIMIEYTNSWKNEFEKTKSVISNYFEQDATTEIITILTEWEEAQKGLYVWTVENVYGENRSKYGTEIFDSEYEYLIDAYRAKTFWLKHILYLRQSEETE